MFRWYFCISLEYNRNSLGAQLGSSFSPSNFRMSNWFEGNWMANSKSCKTFHAKATESILVIRCLYRENDFLYTIDPSRMSLSYLVCSAVGVRVKSLLIFGIETVSDITLQLGTFPFYSFCLLAIVSVGFFVVRAMYSDSPFSTFWNISFSMWVSAVFWDIYFNVMMN